MTEYIVALPLGLRTLLIRHDTYAMSIVDLLCPQHSVHYDILYWYAGALHLSVCQFQHRLTPSRREGIEPPCTSMTQAPTFHSWFDVLLIRAACCHYITAVKQKGIEALT